MGFLESVQAFSASSFNSNVLDRSIIAPTDPEKHEIPKNSCNQDSYVPLIAILFKNAYDLLQNTKNQDKAQARRIQKMKLNPAR